MFKKLLGLVLILTFSCPLISQQRQFNFGDVSKKDLKMTAYENDAQASAVYLINNGKAEFSNNDYRVVMDVHVRIKILGEAGLNYADVQLSYIQNETNFTSLQAAIYNLEDGQIVKSEIAEEDWIDEKVNDKRFIKKLSFPDARIGSVIEYKYKRFFGSLEYLPGWVFQASIPTVYSEYEIDIPRNGKYQPNFQGNHEPSYMSDKGDKYHIVMEHVPALKREPYVSTIENYRSKIDFEINSVTYPGYPTKVFMKDWESINTSLLANQYFGKALDDKSLVTRVYPLDKNWTNDLESMIEIYDFIKGHFTWNKYVSYSVNSASNGSWKRAIGNNVEINFTLHQFLEIAGFEVYPVISSTRNNGFINENVPNVNQFNYMVVAAIIDGKTYLLDATSKVRPYNILPSFVINGIGLMITPDGPIWVDMNTNGEVNSKTINVDFEISEDLHLKGSASQVFTSSAAAGIRSSVIEKKGKGVDILDKENGPFKNYFIGEVKGVDFSNLLDLNTDFELTYDFEVQGKVGRRGDEIYLNPMLFRMIQRNPFWKESRLYPVEFPEPISDTFFFNLEIPEGYEIKELPKSEEISLPNNGGKYMFNVSLVGNKVVLMLGLQLDKVEYSIEEYTYLKALYEKILEKQELNLVLKKLSE